MATTITNPVSYGGKNEQLAIGQGVMKAFAAGRTDQLKRDYFQQTILDKENEKISKVYDSINTIPQTGVDTFDSNINRFFNEGADRIFEVKNLINDGHMTQQEGMKIISETNNYINKYKTLAPKIVDQIKYYNDAKANGTFSRINDNGMAAMLDAISNGSGDVQLLEKDGMMYLSGAGSLNTKDGQEDWKYTMNIDKLGNLLSDPSFAMIKTIPTFTELGIDEIFEAQKSLLNGALTPQQTTDANGVVTTKNVYNPKRLGELMVKSGMYADLLNDPEMGVVWSDSVHATDEVGSFKPWDPNDKDMRNTMEAWLIDKAIARNIPPNEITQVQFPKSQTSGDGSFGGGSGFMQQLFGDVKVAGKEFFDMMAIDPVEGENIEGGEGGANMGYTGKKLTAKSYTLDPDKAIDILQRYTTGDSFYSTLDSDSIDDLIAKQINTINSLTETDFTDVNSDYNEYYDSDLSLEQNKKKLIKTQGDIIRTNVKSLTPNDGKARSVIVIRKGELKPTKVKGDIYSVLKEVIENTNYISGKDVESSLKMLNYVTNENLGGNDVNKWGEFDTFFEETDDNGTVINMDYSSNKTNNN